MSESVSISEGHDHVFVVYIVSQHAVTMNTPDNQAFLQTVLVKPPIPTPYQFEDLRLP